MLGDRWGVTDAEVADRYGCDDVVAEPTLRAWRGVTVHASAERIWPWVAQIRLGPYSYDWVDNLGRRSPRELRGLPDPRVGEPFTRAAGGRPMGKILAVDPGRELTAEIVGAVMSYRVTSPGGSDSRLVLKIVARSPRLLAPVVCLGDLVMARKQLLTLASLAERP